MYALYILWYGFFKKLLTCYNKDMTRTETMTAKDFALQIAHKDGNFVGKVFDFPVTLSHNFDFPLDFSQAIFEDKFSCNHATFSEEVSFRDAVFRHDADFSLANFADRAHFDRADLHGTTTFRRTQFDRMVHFVGTYFYGDAFFERTSFMREVLFVKAHFLRDVYFHKTYFGMRADFSYSAFADLYVSSFFSIRSTYERMDGVVKENLPPRLVFRYVFFPRKTMFTNVDLSRVIFQNSMIEQIIFKDCQFSQKDGRNCFYSEIARVAEFKIAGDAFDRIESGEVGMDYRVNDYEKSLVNIGDVIIFINKDNPQEKYKTFVTERHLGRDWESLFSKLEINHPYIDYGTTYERIKGLYSKEEMKDNGVVAFGFKKFDDMKHWENLEDMNRQMKKSLEDSKDWQRAGDFYRGEMEAMIELMKVKKEKPIYRNALAVYGVVSGFCESVGRIFLFMMISFGISLLLLNQFKPEFSFVQLLEYSLGFFIPLLGSESISLRSLELTPIQNIIVMVEILWYYVLWFFMVLTLRRKFKR